MKSIQELLNPSQAVQKQKEEELYYIGLLDKEFPGFTKTEKVGEETKRVIPTGCRDYRTYYETLIFWKDSYELFLAPQSAMVFEQQDRNKLTFKQLIEKNACDEPTSQSDADALVQDIWLQLKARIRQEMNQENRALLDQLTHIKGLKAKTAVIETWNLSTEAKIEIVHQYYLLYKDVLHKLKSNMAIRAPGFLFYSKTQSPVLHAINAGKHVLVRICLDNTLWAVINKITYSEQAKFTLDEDLFKAIDSNNQAAISILLEYYTILMTRSQTPIVVDKAFLIKALKSSPESVVKVRKAFGRYWEDKASLDKTIMIHVFDTATSFNEFEYVIASLAKAPQQSDEYLSVKSILGVKTHHSSDNMIHYMICRPDICSNNQFKKFMELLKEKATSEKIISLVNARNNLGQTPLMAILKLVANICEPGHLKMLEERLSAFLALKPSASMADRYEVSPLVHSLKMSMEHPGRVPFLSMLLNAELPGLNVSELNMQNETDDTTVHTLVMSTSYTAHLVIKVLCSLPQVNFNIRNRMGLAPFQSAAAHGTFETLNVLLHHHNTEFLNHHYLNGTSYIHDIYMRSDLLGQANKMKVNETYYEVLKISENICLALWLKGYSPTFFDACRILQSGNAVHAINFLKFFQMTVSDDSYLNFNCLKNNNERFRWLKDHGFRISKHERADVIAAYGMNQPPIPVLVPVPLGPIVPGYKRGSSTPESSDAAKKKVKND